LEDDSIQKYGVIIILHNMGSFSLTDHFNRKDMKLFIQTLIYTQPLRVVGVHLSYTSMVYRIVLPFILFCLGKNIRARLRLHTHPDTLVKELQQFGLSSETLPTPMGGTFEFNSAVWKEERKRNERI
jgi:hypothetical protein